MIVFGILASIALLGVVCWAMFNLAVFALPTYAGISAGMSAMHGGHGVLASIGIGFGAGLAVLLVSQLLLVLVPSTAFRIVVGLGFAIPASVAGYHAMHGLTGIVLSAEGWRIAFAWAGGILVGGVAFARMMTPIIPVGTPAPRALPAE